jgi:hypothetical protein
MPCSGAPGTICGGPSALTFFTKTSALAGLSSDLTSTLTTSISVPVSIPSATAIPLALTSGWSSASAIGIAEGLSGRALQGAMIDTPDMTIPKCLSYCTTQGYQYAGLEFATQCWCGNALLGGASLSLTSQNCNMKCGGDSQICGGPDCLNIFVNPSLAVVSSTPVSVATSQPTIALPSGWSLASTVGIAEGTTGRALQGAMIDTPDMTVPKCLNYCTTQGFQYAGLQYSTQCWCGSSFSGGASLSLTSPSCNMPCGGQAGTICGGPSCLTVYVNPTLAITSTSSAPVTVPTAILPSGWTVASTGIAEGSTGRALQGASTTSDSMTPTLCANFCASKGFPYAGMEYKSECYCGSTLSGGASLSLTSSACNMACSGDSTQICGGPSCITLLYNPSITASITSTAASIATSTPSQALNLPSGWSAASTNCIQEVNGRALTGASTSGPSMTIETCIAYCTSQGFGMAGLEYTDQCFCGASLVNGASLSLVSGQCNMPCAANSAEICGGPDAISLFVNPNLVQAVASSVTPTSSASPVATSAISINGFTSSGCIQEVSGRALRGAFLGAANMTLETCVSFCSSQGFSLAGLEYSQECRCDSALQGGASLSLVSGQCVMPCGGNANEICGGPNAITLFSNPSVSPVSSVTPSSTTSTSSTAPAPTVALPALPAGWSIASTPCLAEATQGGRALAAASTSSPQMTTSMCLNYCQGQGYQYAGIEFSQECYCANALSNGASFSISSNSCSMKCSGDSSSICGGPDAISFYTNPSLAQPVSSSSSSPASTNTAASTYGFAQPSTVAPWSVNAQTLTVASSTNVAFSTMAAPAYTVTSTSTASAPANTSPGVAASSNGFATKGCIQEVSHPFHLPPLLVALLSVTPYQCAYLQG